MKYGKLSRCVLDDSHFRTHWIKTLCFSESSVLRTDKHFVEGDRNAEYPVPFKSDESGLAAYYKARQFCNRAISFDKKQRMCKNIEPNLFLQSLLITKDLPNSMHTPLHTHTLEEWELNQNRLFLMESNTGDDR